MHNIYAISSAINFNAIDYKCAILSDDALTKDFTGDGIIFFGIISVHPKINPSVKSPCRVVPFILATLHAYPPTIPFPLLFPLDG